MKLKMLAAFCTSVMALAVCTACGNSAAEPSAAETSAPEAVTTAAEEAEEPAETAEVVEAEDVEFEEIAEPGDGDAFLYINDEQFWVSFDGKPTSILAYGAECPAITGDGDYTVSVDAGTKGAQFEIGGDPDGDYKCSGIAFAAVIVKAGTTLYPDMCIDITEIRVDGKAITPVAKNYTSSDDGKEMRANIYNQWVNNFPDDAHTADGAVTGEFGEYSSQIVNLDDFKTWQKVEVDFTVTGTGTGEAAGGEENAEEAEPTAEESSEESSEEAAE